jgi:hypothetical protein
MVGRGTVSPLKSMVMRRVVMAMAITTHHLRLRSVTRCILDSSQDSGPSGLLQSFGSLALSQ